jgi:hypothetical protein
VNYSERKSLIISFALFFLVVLISFLNYLSISRTSYSDMLSIGFYGLAFTGMFVITILGNILIA